MATTEQTFRAFTPAQAAAYAQHRGGSYPQPLYQAILDYHTGPKSTVLDVGTGPGKVLFDLLPDFERGYGCDTSGEMIARARLEAEKLHLESLTSFTVTGGETCETSVPETEHGKVDLITVAMTAHWLDMPAFYADAAKLLRPGGTLAMWTCSNYYVHPSTPRAAEAQRILSDLQDVWLKDFSTPGNRLSDLAYTTLPLPWTIPSPCFAFKEEEFERKDWDLNGVPSAPDRPDGTAGPFLGGDEEDLEVMKKGLGSASMVIRWREANPEKAETEEDCVNVTMRKLREVVGPGAKIITAGSFSLLLMRRA